MFALLAGAAAGCTSDASLTTGTAGFAPGAGSAFAALADAGDDAEGDASGRASYDDNASYSGRYAYRCDNGERIQVENTVTQVAIAAADGAVVQLPASPADSHTRYVQDQYAIIFDGQEALYFRPKEAPATCRRTSSID